LSGRGLCDGLITGLEESYRLWRVVWVISKTVVNEAIARVGLQRHMKKKKNTNTRRKHASFLTKIKYSIRSSSKRVDGT
jgi:hypothetical protein